MHQQRENNTEFQGDIVPVFDKTLLGSAKNSIDPVKWDHVVELYEKGRFRDSLLGILDYVDSKLAERTGNPEKTEFKIPHGSAIVYLKIDENGLNVSAPFLTLPSTRNVPLLRQIAQINLFPLNLSNIVLENDRLTFKFACPLELCEPYKIYDTLREICAYADAYDDEFIKKFGAKRFHQPSLKRFQQNYMDDAWNRTQLYARELENYLEYFEKRRMFEFCLDIMVITFMKIDYYATPQGVVRTDIEKTINYLQDQEIPLTDRLRKGHEFLKEVLDYKRDEFQRSLYLAETFIPLKFNFTGEMIDSYFEGFYDSIKKEIAGRDYMGSVLTMQVSFMNLYYFYIVPEDIKTIITESLMQSSRKSWEKASAILWQAVDDILNQRKPKRKKSFWGTLFRSKQ